MKESIMDLISQDNALDNCLRSVTITNPNSRQASRSVNALILEEEDGMVTVILCQTSSQFKIWRLNLEPGLIVTEGTRRFVCKYVSYAHYPKYPILQLEFVKEEEQDKAKKAWEDKLHGKFGIVFN